MSRSTSLLLFCVVVGLATGIAMNWRTVNWRAILPTGEATTGLPPADISMLPRSSEVRARSAPAARSSDTAGGSGASVSPGRAGEAGDAAGSAAAPDAATTMLAAPRTEPTIRIIAEPASELARLTLFVSGNALTWNRIDVEVTSPLLLQAGGQIAAGGAVSSPDGLTTAPSPTGPIDDGDPILPWAPFLSLIGRVCSTAECSAPFVIGSRSVVCPSVVGVRGMLEVWTNNRARLGDAQTRSSYSAATGGYHVYVEPAPESACGAPAAVQALTGDDRSILAAGRTLDRTEFTVSSSQGNWKPFFVPLERPIRISASGDVSPMMRAQATGPDGIVVPPGARWVYPGASQIVVDAEHQLFAPSLPYQALIGRVCGTSGCGQVFLVGSAKTVCAPPGYRDRLELWINQILPPATLLGRSLPMSMQAFTLQSRTGAYRFRVDPAPEGACGA